MKELSAPPAEPVFWEAVVADVDVRVVVVSRTWFAARTEAMRICNVGPDDVIVVLKEGE